MRQEPPSRQRRVALARVDVHVSISVFTLAVDDVLTVECVALVERLVRSKAVSIDGQRLLLAVAEQESNRRFGGGFRRVNVRLATTTVSENKHRRLVLLICPTTVRGQATQARPAVALAALLLCGNAQFVDLDRAF
jgi:hypothetical protein